MIIGIDVGTIHSKVCLQDNTGKVSQVNLMASSELEKQSFILPSVVGSVYGQLQVGYDILDQAEDADMLIKDLKRDIGKSVPYAAGNAKFTVEDAYQALFIYLKNCAEQETGGQLIDRTYVAYPAVFDNKARQVLARAATRAGALQVELVAEPVAIAMNYCKEKGIDKDATFLVYDLGGGTFDTAIVTRKDGKYALAGDAGHIDQCGGRMIDSIVYQLIMNKMGKVPGTLSEKQQQKLQADVARLSTKFKHQLSNEKEVFDKVLINGAWTDISITRDEFNGAVVKLIDTTFDCVKELTRKLHISDKDIDAVIATGGSCNIPLVKERLQKLWPDKVTVMSGSHVVAQGAVLAMQGTGQTHESDDNDISAKCTKCGSNSVGTYYCRKCGWVARYPDYITDDSMKVSYQANVQRFVNDLKSIENIKLSRLAEASISRYANVINKAKRIARNNEWIPEKTVRSADDFLEQCTSGEFHIAVIGTINAGKSTLINALLERELASTNVTPETAALTKFRRADKVDYIKITFFTKSEWKNLWENVNNSRATIFKKSYKELNAMLLEKEWVGHEDLVLDTFEDNAKFSEMITTWTSAKKPNHYFVKEIEIGLIDLDIPKEIVLVDTPGLNDPVTHRSDITRDYMNRANVVLVCVKVDRLTGNEMETIMNVFANLRYAPQKVFVLATQIDNLNKIDEDWANTKNEWMQHLSGPNCYNDRVLAERNLIPIAAYLDRLLTKFECSEKPDYSKAEEKLLRSRLGILLDAWDLNELKDPEIMAKMRGIANMSALRKRLMNEEVEHAQQLIYQDIAEKYKSLKVALSEPIFKIRELQLGTIVSANSGLDKILKELEDTRVVLKENKEQKEELDNAIKIFSDQLDRKVGTLIKEIKNVNKN